ncbi:MAG: ParA family protein, partial [Actinomycetota bacterium]
LSEAPSYGEPVLTLDPSARGSVAYRLLAAEVEDRYGLTRHVPPPPNGARETEPAGPPETAAVAAPGPGGRGYGTLSPEPPGLDEAWPRREPWGVQS